MVLLVILWLSNFNFQYLLLSTTATELLTRHVITGVEMIFFFKGNEVELNTS